LVALVALVIMVNAALLRSGQYSLLHPILLILGIAAWVPLLWRTRAPIAVLLIVTSIHAVQIVLVATVSGLTDGSNPIAVLQPVPVAAMVALLEVSLHRRIAVAWAAAFVSAAVLTGLAATVLPGREHAPLELVLANLMLLTTLVGTAIASTRDRRIERMREQDREVEGAVVRERLAMARELHDVLAHNLMLINAQAGVAEFLFDDDPVRAREALTGITGHARRAVEELGGTVRLLRDPAGGLGATVFENEVTPHLLVQDIPRLIATVTASGAAVELVVTGEPWEASGLTGLAAYRIVQEALTNAAKHSPGSQATVTLDWAGSDLSVFVRNGPARVTRSVAPSRGGFGLVGMKERAEAAGGTLAARLEPDGGFLVRAVLPRPDKPVDESREDES
jgi:signal transduction histidine kinase